MSAILLDGRALSADLKRELTTEVTAFKSRQGVTPCIATVQAGDDQAAAVYARRIAKSHRDLGMECRTITLPAGTGEPELASTLHRLGDDPTVHGVLLLLPLPPPLRAETAVVAVPPEKDVDGVHPVTAGRLYLGLDTFVPNTPAGGMEMLRRYDIPLGGKRAAIVGRSNIVGKPMALQLLWEDATVTLCHSRTHHIQDLCRNADVLVVAVGRPKLVGPDWVKPGAAVIDFGINPTESGVVGDVDFDAVQEIAGWITPVPGGTGPVTNLMLCRNTLKAARGLAGN